MEGFIPLSVPNLKGNEINYVTDALEKEWVSTGGSYIERFEKEIADYLHVEQAVACQSGTSAIHLALLESNISAEDEVIVPTLTFIAAVNPVKYCNAHPVFMDCDESFTMDMNKLEEFCENECDFDGEILINKKSKRKVKAVIVVHVFGNMADMEHLIDISEKYNLKIIEDATEALGTYYTEGRYKGRFAGTIGDFGCYSFNGNKIITTGGGGMIVAKNNQQLAHIKYLSTQAKDDTLNYIHNEVGYNYRMTNLQAALGVAQLEKLEEFIMTKLNNYSAYKKEIDKIDGVSIAAFKNKTRSNHWFYSLIIEDSKILKDKLMKRLYEQKIQTRPIWGLINEQKPYINEQQYKIDKAKYYYDRVINIPCSTNLSEEKVRFVVESIKKYVNQY